MILSFLSSSLHASEILISNGGQGSINSNYIAFYGNGTSALIGGYEDPNGDNGHCVSGIVDGNPITIIIPESLGKFGIIQPGCQYPNYNAKCASLNDGVVVQGQNITVGSNLVSLSVSPLCQQIAAYLINNFSDPNSTGYQIVEYAKSDVSATSYCSVQFVPKSSGFRLRINTDYLLYSGHILPGSCSVGSADPNSSESDKEQQSQLVATNPGQQSSCKLNLLPNSDVFYDFIIPQSSLQNMSAKSLNDWVGQNLSAITSANETNPAPPPPAGYFQCVGNQEICPAVQQAVKDEIVQQYQNQESSLINMRLRFKRYPSYMPSLPKNPTAEEQKEYDTYQDWMNKASSDQKNAYQEYYQSTKKRISDYITDEISKAEASSAGIQCVGTSSTDLNGNPVISYSCTTLKQDPEYTCNFVYTISDNSNCTGGSCSMQLSSAYCSFPPSIAMQSPQTGGQDFNCGFCGSAEINTVGNSPIATGIESGSMGPTNQNSGVLYPYKTDNVPHSCPTSYPGCRCSFGFATTLNPSGTYSPFVATNELSLELPAFNFTKDNVNLIYRNSAINCAGSDCVQTITQSLAAGQSMLQNAEAGVIDGLVIGNCNGLSPQSNGSCIGANSTAPVFQGDGSCCVGVSKSLTGRPLLFVSGVPTNTNILKRFRCSSDDPFCSLLDDNYNVKGSIFDEANKQFSIFNGSANTQNVKYDVVWGDYINPQTTCGGCGTQSKTINNLQDVSPGLPPSARATGTVFGNLKQNWLFSYDGINQISVSQSANGKPIMFVGRSGGEKYHYTSANPNGKELDSNWMPKSS